MAQHNPGSRAFLLIVLGGIVIGFVIAVFLLGGDDETSVKTDEIEAPIEQPAAEAPPPAAPADDMTNENTPPDEMPAEDAGMPGDVMPPDEMPADDVMPPDELPAEDAGMPDDMTPPDEMNAMPEEAMPDEAPDAMTPDENPEAAVPENPPPAPNP